MIQWLAVSIGGALGASCRYWLALALPAKTASWPWATFSANVLGSCLFGFLFVIVVEKSSASEYWRLFLLTGFLGALTTFSTFSFETFILWQQGHLKIAALYGLLSFVATLVAIVIGYRFAHFIF